MLSRSPPKSHLIRTTDTHITLIIQEIPGVLRTPCQETRTETKCLSILSQMGIPNVDLAGIWYVQVGISFLLQGIGDLGLWSGHSVSLTECRQSDPCLGNILLLEQVSGWSSVICSHLEQLPSQKPLSLWNLPRVPQNSGDLSIYLYQGPGNGKNVYGLYFFPT